MNTYYVAIELDDDGNLNDAGRLAMTKEAAWEMVKDVFYAPKTVIAKVTPKFLIQAAKYKITPIDNRNTTKE